MKGNQSCKIGNRKIKMKGVIKIRCYLVIHGIRLCAIEQNQTWTKENQVLPWHFIVNQFKCVTILQ